MKGKQMNTVRKILSVSFVVAMMLSLSIPTYAAASEYTDLIPRNLANEIFEKYPSEISFVEEKYDITINRLDKSTNDLLKKEAAENYTNEAFDFSGLMTELALEKARNSTGISPMQIHVNEDWDVYAEYGPVVGEVLEEVAAGITQTYTDDFTISIRAGDEALGVEFSSGCSSSSSYTVQGPEDGTKMANGMKASHRIAVGILLGTVMKYEYDMYDPWTGAGGHYIEYYVEDAAAKDYTLLVLIANPTYVEKASGRSTIRCENYQEFQNELWANPNRFLV